MIALTVVVHVVGIIVLIESFRGRVVRKGGPQTLFRMVGVLVFTVLSVFLFHTIEIWLWALLYIGLGTFEVMERALYFSTVTFTTLGYGDITLSPRWQLLSAFEAVNGIILIGVSTAFVFAVIQRLHQSHASDPS
jgi:voltage-gated potassium channel Kch